MWNLGFHPDRGPSLPWAHSSCELSCSDTQSLWFLGVPINPPIHAECNATSPNQGRSKNSRAHAKKGLMCSQQELPAQVTYPVFWSYSFHLCLLLGVEIEEQSQGKRVAGSWQKEGVVGNGEWITLLSAQVLPWGLFISAFGLFWKVWTLKHQGWSTRLLAWAVNSEFHSSLECPLQEEIPQSCPLLRLNDSSQHSPWSSLKLALKLSPASLKSILGLGESRLVGFPPIYIIVPRHWIPGSRASRILVLTHSPPPLMATSDPLLDLSKSVGCL